MTLNLCGVQKEKYFITVFIKAGDMKGYGNFQRNFSNKRWNKRFSMNPLLNHKVYLIRTTYPSNSLVKLCFLGGS